MMSTTTLANLSHSKDPKLDLLDTYRAFQTKIEGVTCRVISAGVPVVISSGYFH